MALFYMTNQFSPAPFLLNVVFKLHFDSEGRTVFVFSVLHNLYIVALWLVLKLKTVASPAIGLIRKNSDHSLYNLAQLGTSLFEFEAISFVFIPSQNIPEIYFPPNHVWGRSEAEYLVTNKWDLTAKSYLDLRL